MVDSGSEHSPTLREEKDGMEEPSPRDGLEDEPEENRRRADGGEKGEDGPPQSVGFWHPSLNKTRKNVIFLWAQTSV